VTTDDPEAGRKDFVLRYRLAGGRIQTGLLLSPGEDENHFLMLMEPPRRVKPDEVPPREYVFVVDVSGSMNGFPLEDVGKPLMREMIRNLRPNDYMNLMLFAGGSEVLSERGSLAASEANKQKAVRFLESRHGGGGTEILPALRRAMKLPQTEGVSRIVVVVTDGFVHVEAEAFELIRKHLDRANLFAFGIGSSVNRFLIEGMARAGWGRPFVALNPNQGVLEARKFKEYISSPVLTDVAVRFQGFRAYDVEPLAVPDLFASRPITLIGKYKGGPEGQIEVTGRTGGGEFRRVVAAESAQVADSDRAIGLLWARKRIQRLADMNRLDPKDDRIDQVTNLGLEYGLMTQYTSFVAVDKVKRADGTLETVKQPLPLPVGVSDQAVGGRNKAGGLGMARTMVKRAAPALEADQALVREQPPAPKPEPKDKKAESPAPSTLTHDRLTLTIGEVRGGLDRGDLSRTLRPLMPHMDGCFGPSGGGQLTLRLIWNENGRLDRIEAVNTASGLESARRCLEGALKGLKLESDGGAVAVLSFTI
jgi:Ca-activated chloride channel family protein